MSELFDVLPGASQSPTESIHGLEARSSADQYRDTLVAVGRGSLIRNLGNPAERPNSLQTIVLESSSSNEAFDKLSQIPRSLISGSVRGKPPESSLMGDKEYVFASNLFTNEEVENMVTATGGNFNELAQQAVLRDTKDPRFRINVGQGVEVEVRVANYGTPQQPEYRPTIHHGVVAVEEDSKQPNQLTARDIVTPALDEWKNDTQATLTTMTDEQRAELIEAQRLGDDEDKFLKQALNLPEDAGFFEIKKSLEEEWIAKNFGFLIENRGTVSESVAAFVQERTAAAFLDIFKQLHRGDRVGYKRNDMGRYTEPVLYPDIDKYTDYFSLAESAVWSLKSLRAQRQKVKPYWHLIVAAEQQSINPRQ